MIKTSQIIVLDIETTGLKPRKDLIIEVGICVLDLISGSIKPILDVTCNENGSFFHRRIDKNAWIFSNSTLTPEIIKNSISLHKLKHLLNFLFLNNIVTCFNHSFDLEFLKVRGFSFPRICFDPMLFLTQIMQIPFRNSYNSSYKYFKWPSVQEAWDFLFPNVKYIEKHRAYDDAIHEAMIIKKIFDDYGERDLQFIQKKSN